MVNGIPSETRWERRELPLLVDALAHASGGRVEIGEPVGSPAPDADLAEWIEAACARLRLEAEPAAAPLANLEDALTHAAPALLALPGGGFAGLVSVRRGKARLIAANLQTRTVSLRLLRDLLCAPAEAEFAAEVDQLMRDCRSSFPNPDRARRALLRERAGSSRVAFGWQMRTGPGASFLRQLAASGLRKRIGMFAAGYAVEYALFLCAWFLLGEGALSGRFDFGWMTAWAAVMASALALRVRRSASSEIVAVGLGGLLKQRLMAGTVRLDPDSVRHQGAGQTMARVIEAEALESLALGGGLAALVAPIELIAAAALLFFGAGGAAHAVLLIAWTCALGLLVWRDLGYRAAWTEARLEMTGDLIERMNGHRTRLAQQPPELWHAGEDAALSDYLNRSRALDRSSALINTMVPRLWLVTGLAALVPAFLKLAPPASLAVSIAAVLMAQRSLRTLATGLASLDRAALAWRKVKPLFDAAARTADPGAVNAPPSGGGALLEARELTFRYRDRSEPVLRGCNLTIKRGDWVLLEGASGNGKSTLASIVSGLRAAESGLMLAGGLDRGALGESRWRRRIAYAPQSHENHIFSGSLAFNLLMGRAWPARYEDLAEARAVCEDLGLAELLARMPAGLDQMVGESGWQLSEGERSRVFLGRALLAGADLLVLDECFATLDPESLQAAHTALRRRAGTVLMVAHP